MTSREQPLDVLIIHHPTTNPVRPMRYAAMGLLSLADHLERHGIKAQVINLAIEQREDSNFDVVDYAARRGVRVIGISIHWFFQLRDSLDLVGQLKRRLPAISLVLGGFSASYFARDLMARSPETDAIIRGDGEEPFLAYCQRALDRGATSLEDIPNLVYRTPSGEVRSNDFSHVATSEQLDAYRFANLSLLKNHHGLHSLAQGPSNRFRERFDFDGNGIFLLEIGRGCCFSCSLCGGNWRAQREMARRTRPIFRSEDSVLRTIKSAYEAGHRNIYVSFDADPTASYYLRLFRQIREDGIKVRFMFESWGLTQLSLLEDMARTFTDSMIVLTADSADEAIRRRHKGALSYTNEELELVLSRARELGVAAQVFFGFFLPGDDRGSMMKTRRYAADLQERYDCEALYMDFSTDPGSPVARDPDRYDMAVNIRTLDDYLEALSRPRASPNMVEHRPRSMSPAEASLLITAMNLDQFAQKLFPVSLRYLSTRCGDQRVSVHEAYEAFLLGYAELHGDPLRTFSVEDVSRYLIDQLRGSAALGGDEIAAVCDLVRFEAVPYILKSQQVGQVEVHYSDLCRPADVSAAERTSTLRAGRAMAQRVPFDFDVRAFVEGGSAEAMEHHPTALDFWVDESGRYCVLPTGAGEQT